jgi:hypothetical protein
MRLRNSSMNMKASIITDFLLITNCSRSIIITPVEDTSISIYTETIEDKNELAQI